MMVVALTYRRAEGTTPLYDFYDIASSTGYVTLYAGKTAKEISGAGILSNETFYSAQIDNTPAGATLISGAHTSATPLKCIDIDFDVLMNKSMTVKGKGIITVTNRIMTDGVGIEVSGSPVAKIRKWDGTTETEIATGYGDKISGSVLGTLKYGLSTINVTIPQTTIKKGEYLRLTIEGYMNYVGGSSSGGYYAIAFDPMGRVTNWDSNYPTTLTFKCPTSLYL